MFREVGWVGNERGVLGIRRVHCKTRAIERDNMFMNVHELIDVLNCFKKDTVSLWICMN